MFYNARHFYLRRSILLPDAFHPTEPCIADNFLHEAANIGNPPSGIVYIGKEQGSLGVHEHWNNPSLEARKLEVQPLLNGGSWKRTAFPLCLGFTYIASTDWSSFRGMGTYNSIVDLMAHERIGGNTLVYLVDAFRYKLSPKEDSLYLPPHEENCRHWHIKEVPNK